MPDRLELPLLPDNPDCVPPAMKNCHHAVWSLPVQFELPRLAGRAEWFRELEQLASLPGVHGSPAKVAWICIVVTICPPY